MFARNIAAIACLAIVCACGQAQERRTPASETRPTGTSSQPDLWEIVRNAPKLPFQARELKAQPPRKGWQMGMVSWIAVDPRGRIFLLQRGDKADPIVVINRHGHVLHSWGKGMYTMPHALRIDSLGNIWTTDAATSMVYKFTPQGRKLMEIAVGGQPSPCMHQQIVPERPSGPNNFCGTTDIAFAPNGHIFIADGYANNRILEYSADGKKVNEWGSAGTGPGQFRLPHSIRIDEEGVIYIADRENGRIQRFELNGKYLGEWPNLGRIFSLDIHDRAIWIATQPLELANGSPGWLLKLDRATGKVLGYVEVTGGHGMVALDNGELMVGPGPGRAAPQWFRPIP